MRRPGAGTKGYREAAEDTTATLRVHESGPRVEARVDVLASLGMRDVRSVGESSVCHDLSLLRLMNVVFGWRVVGDCVVI